MKILAISLSTFVCSLLLCVHAFACFEGEARTHEFSQNKFICDKSRPELGESFRAPDGLIWGEIVQKCATPSVCIEITADFEEASQFCKSIGARVPTRYDYISLVESMGAKIDWYDKGPPSRYRVSLYCKSCVKEGKELLSQFGRHTVWTSSHMTLGSGNNKYYFGFNENYGDETWPDPSRQLPFRCVR